MIYKPLPTAKDLPIQMLAFGCKSSGWCDNILYPHKWFLRHYLLQKFFHSRRWLGCKSSGWCDSILLHPHKWFRRHYPQQKLCQSRCWYWDASSWVDVIAAFQVRSWLWDASPWVDVMARSLTTVLTLPTISGFQIITTLFKYMREFSMKIKA